MTYPEALKYLETFIDYEKINDYDYKNSVDLERMRRLCHLLGDPQQEIKSIHIAGTKGKGSTAAFAHSILQKSGFRTGLYTSPHLISFRERIRINQDLIEEESIRRLTEKIKAVVETPRVKERPTFFEVYTALAYLYFKEQRVDFAVYEVGLGGRLDATNIIEPLVSAITPLSLEHTERLGNSLSAIAAEKAGIIKEGITCVSAPQEDEALEVIKKVCEERGSELVLIGRDVIYEELRCGPDFESFKVHGRLREYRDLKSRLLGSHQMVNAATAIGITEVLESKGIPIVTRAVSEGIEAAQWEGRLEVVGNRPLVVFDGAQNRASAGVLAENVKKIFRHERIILVLGVSKDKDIDGMLAELLPVSNSVVLTKSALADRALEPSEIKRRMKSGMDTRLTSNVCDAMKFALSKASPEDLVLVTGSLFVVGEAKVFMEKNPRMAADV
ncbi:MAG: bifunctional folylpolyglutamate synthase/dihydrofolate synthase [Candidatus Omnitrophica bacterium]|nr:bifunctional folylpolyglutamate synthase/dihydrofolate synthase [Candidatus Omnitrophota bacterium]